MNGYSTLYAHMTSYCVANGDYVERGQVIGYVGATGWATGNHFSAFHRLPRRLDGQPDGLYQYAVIG